MNDTVIKGGHVPPKASKWDLQGMVIRAMMGRLGLNSIKFYSRELQIPVDGGGGMSLKPGKPDDIHDLELVLTGAAAWPLATHNLLAEDAGYAHERLIQASRSEEKQVSVDPRDIWLVLDKYQKQQDALRLITEQVDAAIPVRPHRNDYELLLSDLDAAAKVSVFDHTNLSNAAAAIRSLLEELALVETMQSKKG